MAKTVSIILIALIPLLLRVSSLPAEEGQHVSNYYSEYGHRLWQDGQKELAAEQFVKALFLDMDNSQARQYLQEFLITENGADQQRLLRFLETIDYLRFLKGRMRELTAANNGLIRFIIENGDFDPVLVIRAKDLQENQSFVVDQELLGKAAGEAAEGLAAYYFQLDELKQSWQKQVQSLQAAQQELRTLKSKVVTHLGDTKKQKLARVIEVRFDDIRSRLEQKDQMLQAQEGKIKSLNDELSSVKKEFQEIADRFQQTDQKITALTQDMAGMTLELYEKNRLLAERDVRVADLENELKEVRERLTLVQHIIREKNRKIQSLETGLNDKGMDSGTGLIPAQAWQPESPDTVADQSLSTRLGGPDIEMDRLKAIALFQDKKVKDYQAMVSRQAREVKELEGILEIYRGRLKDAMTGLKQRDDEYQRLELRLKDWEAEWQDMSGHQHERIRFAGGISADPSGDLINAPRAGNTDNFLWHTQRDLDVLLTHFSETSVTGINRPVAVRPDGPGIPNNP